MQTTCNELVKVLKRAYPRCLSFDETCGRHGIQCADRSGHLPRGYSGALGKLSDVKLVLVLAEPGNPDAAASFRFPKDRAKAVRQIAMEVADAIERSEERKSAFHINLRTILNECWLGMPFAKQMKHTWITESVLCSAPVSAGPLAKPVEIACTRAYLKQQLALLSEAFVVCLGGKAEQRMKRAGLKYDFRAGAPGKPGGYSQRSKESWVKLGKEFQKCLKRK